MASALRTRWLDSLRNHWQPRPASACTLTWEAAWWAGWLVVRYSQTAYMLVPWVTCTTFWYSLLAPWAHCSSTLGLAASEKASVAERQEVVIWAWEVPLCCDAAGAGRGTWTLSPPPQQVLGKWQFAFTSLIPAEPRCCTRH